MMGQTEKRIDAPVTNGCLRVVLLSVLVLLGISVLSVAIIGGLPPSVACINLVGDAMVMLFAFSFMVLCGVGLLCIVWKGLRRPALIVTCLWGALLLVEACLNVVFMKVGYMMAKDSEAVERQCVVTSRHDDDLGFRFLDDGTEGTASLDYYNRLFEGDTCVARVQKGWMGMEFITNMRCIKRNNNKHQ